MVVSYETHLDFVIHHNLPTLAHYRDDLVQCLENILWDSAKIV